MTCLEPYAQTDLADLLDDLNYEFLDLSVSALEHYVRRAAIYMCRNGDLAVQKVVVRTLPNVRNYLLEPSDDTELVALLGVRCVTPGQSGWVIRALSEPPRQFGGPVSWFVAPNELFIESPFRGSFEAEFSVAPSRTSCSVPSVLADRWYEVLLTGARHYIHDASGKPWSDKKLALELLAEFRSGVQRAKVECMTGFQRGVLRMNTPRVP
jgi:hypothetical protein